MDGVTLAESLLYRDVEDIQKFIKVGNKQDSCVENFSETKIQRIICSEKIENFQPQFVHAKPFVTLANVESNTYSNDSIKDNKCSGKVIQQVKNPSYSETKYFGKFGMVSSQHLTENAMQDSSKTVIGLKFMDENVLDVNLGSTPFKSTESNDCSQFYDRIEEPKISNLRQKFECNLKSLTTQKFAEEVPDFRGQNSVMDDAIIEKPDLVKSATNLDFNCGSSTRMCDLELEKSMKTFYEQIEKLEQEITQTEINYSMILSNHNALFCESNNGNNNINKNKMESCLTFKTIHNCIESLCSATIKVLRLVNRIQQLRSDPIPTNIFTTIQRPLYLIKNLQNENGNLLRIQMDNSAFKSLLQLFTELIRRIRNALWASAQLCNPDNKDISTKFINYLAENLIHDYVKTYNTSQMDLNNLTKNFSSQTNKNFSANQVDSIQRFDINRTISNSLDSISKTMLYQPNTTVATTTLIWPNTNVPIYQRSVLQHNPYIQDKLTNTNEQLRTLVTSHIGPIYAHQAIVFSNNPRPTQPTFFMPSLLNGNLSNNLSVNSRIHNRIPGTLYENCL